MNFAKTKLVVAIAGAALSSVAFGHGYMQSPEARSFHCKLGNNTGCGPVQYEPQSVEGADGAPRFPIGGPADGTIAGAGVPTWSQLNAQSPTRWFKSDFASGYQDFTWRFTANHVTRDWRYFITKADWNPAAQLTRDQFELAPFCEVDGGMVQPPFEVTHKCLVPEREGYHVVLAVWDVGDTAASFYNVLDLNFDGTNPFAPTPVEPEVDPFTEVGLISGAIPMEAGDAISTRVFVDGAEDSSLSVSFQATEYTSGAAASLALARAINDAGLGYYSGARDGDLFIPAAGQNRIYTDTNIGNIETTVTFAPEPEFVYEATLAADSVVEINEMGMTDVYFTISVNANSRVTATLFNEFGDTVIGDDYTLGGTQELKLHVHEPEAGELTLIVVAESLDTNATEQLTAVVRVEDNRVNPDMGGMDGHSGHDGMDIGGSCDTDPMASMNPAFDITATYTGGELVSFNGLVYQAKWWTRGAAPDATDAFELVSDAVLPYSDATTYQGGDRATYQGGLYEAKWWTRGINPQQGPFTRIGDAPTC